MRVNTNIPPITIGGPDPGRRAQRADGDGSRADQIHLSTVARSAAEAHTDKLASLRAQVAGGSFRPTADEIADTMINEMLR